MSCSCLINLHHSTDGNFSSHVLRPEILLFLKVCIARSTALTWWLCGSDNFTFIFSFSRYFLTALDATLSMMFKTGLKSLFISNMMFSLNVKIVEVSVKYFTGVSNIVFDDQSYSTKISVLPSLDLIGNFPL